MAIDNPQYQKIVDKIFQTLPHSQFKPENIGYLMENSTAPKFKSWRSQEELERLLKEGDIPNLKTVELLRLLRQQKVWTAPNARQYARTIWDCAQQQKPMLNMLMWFLIWKISDRENHAIDHLSSAIPAKLSGVHDDDYTFFQAYIGRKAPTLAHIALKASETIATYLKLYYHIDIEENFRKQVDKAWIGAWLKDSDETRNNNQTALKELLAEYTQAEEQATFFQQDVFPHLKAQDLRQNNYIALVEWIKECWKNHRFRDYLSAPAKEMIEKLLGAANYQQFKKIALYIADKSYNIEGRDKRRLRSRAIFWENYCQTFSECWFIIPQDSVWLDRDASNLFIGDYGSSEVGIFRIGEYLFIEPFCGKINELWVYKFNENLIEIIKDNPDITKIIDQLADLLVMIFDHEYLWQHYLACVLDHELDIQPDNNRITFGLGSRGSSSYPPERLEAKKIDEREKDLRNWERRWERDRRFTYPEDFITQYHPALNPYQDYFK